MSFSCVFWKPWVSEKGQKIWITSPWKVFWCFFFFSEILRSTALKKNLVSLHTRDNGSFKKTHSKASKVFNKLTKLKEWRRILGGINKEVGKEGLVWYSIDERYLLVLRIIERLDIVNLFISSGMYWGDSSYLDHCQSWDRWLQIQGCSLFIVCSNMHTAYFTALLKNELHCSDVLWLFFNLNSAEG